MQNLRSATLFAVVAAFALFVPVQPATAQSGGFEITPFAAYRLSGDVDFDFGPELEVDEGDLFGVSLDFAINDSMQVEVLASRQETDLILDRGLFGERGRLSDITFTTLHGGFLYHWRNGQVDPFVVASAGVTDVDPGFPGSDSEIRPSGSFGGGVKLHFSEHVGLRLEGRVYVTDLDTSFRDDDDDEFDADDLLVQPEISVGVIFGF